MDTEKVDTLQAAAGTTETPHKRFGLHLLMDLDPATGDPSPETARLEYRGSTMDIGGAVMDLAELVLERHEATRPLTVKDRKRLGLPPQPRDPEEHA